MAAVIPVIDVGAMLSGQPRALAETARQVHDALTQVGFFVITGHEVPHDHLCRLAGLAVRRQRRPKARTGRRRVVRFFLSLRGGQRPSNPIDRRKDLNRIASSLRPSQ
ncbi:MAG TPA: 2-oxoglutarate and iron-dependent oxygenase domain-containing protein [Acetobacteraceae bacterium]|nr:2-oxoglutarate and iron-dependent oxygenase domain-containing protein [Acetobacteraceae bacterium]